jgi:hypothetical protein
MPLKPMLLDSETHEPVKKRWPARLAASIARYESAAPSPFFPVVVAYFLYAFIVLALVQRPLWHDELYTYYIANSPTTARFVAAVTQIDLQPPLQYVLTRVSLLLFGDSDIVTRLPSVIAFTVASICLYHFVRRRLGRFYGLTATLVLWLTPFLPYAAEARPYALVLGSFSVAMLGWQTATAGQRRRWGLFGITLGVWGALVSHAFSPLLVAVLGIAELVRSAERRKIDWPVCVALVAPSPFMVVYLPIFRRFEGWAAVPPEFQGSVFKIVTFYSDMLSAVSAVVLIALLAALMVSRSEGVDTGTDAPTAHSHEIALVLGLLSLPIPINLFLIRSGGAFWPRYCIASAIGFSLLSVYILAKLTRGSRAAAGIAACVIFLGMAGGLALQITRPPARAVIKELSLKQLDPRLPLVAASGLTFFEMNKREDAELLSRIFYLTDRDAAIRFSHATIFEGTAVLRKYFPILGTVTAYRDFVRQTPHFFVLGTPDYPEDWLIPKLLDEGAELQFKGELRSSYRDHMIFEVMLKQSSAR